LIFLVDDSSVNPSPPGDLKAQELKKAEQSEVIREERFSACW
jgi:hypothetical protein